MVVPVDIDQLDDPVGIRARRRDVELDRDRPGEGEFLLENIGLVDENVGPARGEALIGAHVLRRHECADLVVVRHRPGRIADVLVERVRSLNGRLLAKSSARVEMQR